MDATVKNGWMSKLHASFYDNILAGAERDVLGARRAELLRPLKGRVLEVGCGTGVNFQYYSKEAQVIGCEPATPMYDNALENLSNNQFSADIRVINTGIQGEVIDAEVDAHSLDAVVFTLVLCSIPDPQLAYQRAKHWLKHGGKLVVLEHIRAGGFLGSALQELITPVWKQCAEGCHLNRTTDKDLRAFGFKPVSESYFDHILPWYQAEMIAEG